MAKKQYFLIADTETTEVDTIADFAGIIVDRKGKIYHEIKVLVDGHYGKHKLFHDRKSSEEIWTLKGLRRRNENYRNMLNNGTRMMSSVLGINNWLSRAKLTYPKLIFCAYNSSFDLGKMRNTGIDAEFADYFCIMRASQNHFKHNRKFVQHCIDRKWFTGKLNMRTNVEAMAEFIMGGELPPEPHTAYEDIIDYELPIFKFLLKRASWKSYSQAGYSWREWTMQNHVIPK